MSYQHEQTEADNIWYVNQNLHTSTPAVDVWVEFQGRTTLILPKNVRVVNPDTVHITFTKQMIGVAIIN
jgi:hypothetical protein